MKIVSIVVAVAVVVLLAVFFTSSDKEEALQETASPQAGVDLSSNVEEEVVKEDGEKVEPASIEPVNEIIVMQSGLIIEDVVKGDGAEAVAGKTIVVHYVGTLENGTEFDSSRRRGAPFSFVLGSGRVIAGWEQGFAGMRIGGVRKLTIPPDLAYGPNGVPPGIPPNATLLFEVELLDVLGS